MLDIPEDLPNCPGPPRRSTDPFQTSGGSPDQSLTSGRDPHPSQTSLRVQLPVPDLWVCSPPVPTSGRVPRLVPVLPDGPPTHARPP